MAEVESEIRSYRDLRVWQEAMNLAEAACRLTGQFPKHEVYGFTAQVRRAAASVPANIAEGYGRESRGAYVQFLRVAQGSVKELETHLLLAERIELIAHAAVAPLLGQCDTIGKMLRGLIRSLDTENR
jgi:four helix bundle protein